MDIDAGTNLATVYDAIVAAIQTKFPALATVEFNREERGSLTVPACLLSMPEFEADHERDPGTGQLAVSVKFEADLILGFRTPEAKLAVQELAAALAARVHAARWPGALTSEAWNIRAYASDFKPELDQYEVWCVEWNQVLHLGVSDWAPGIAPTTIFVGVTPEIGLGNEDKYVQIAPSPYAGLEVGVGLLADGAQPADGGEVADGFTLIPLAE